ncbi:MAG: hypothetical protein MZV65_54535 [Chromatiales bacterium]|nr:hypothetical protein [Chromatiales bacterium]
MVTSFTALLPFLAVLVVAALVSPVALGGCSWRSSEGDRQWEHRFRSRD